MKPLRDLLIVRIEEREEKTKSGLFIAQEKWEKPRNVAEVLEVGPEAEDDFQVGDKVVINPYAAIDTNEKPVKIIKGDDVLCRISVET